MDRIRTPETVFAAGNKLALIYLSMDPENPRESCDLASTMWCWHDRYNLGDDDDKPRTEDFDGWDAVEAYINEHYDVIAMKPLYLYDHSGISISTGEFGDRWDSGQIGFIFVTQEHYREVMGEEASVDPVERMAWAEEVIESDVEVYDHYIGGSVYYGELLDLDDIGKPEVDRKSEGDYYGYNHKESGLLHDLLGSEEAKAAEEISLDEALERIEQAAEEKDEEFYGWR